MLLSDNGSYGHTDRLSDILDRIEVKRVVNSQDDLAVLLADREHYILLSHLLRNELNYLRIYRI